MKICQKHWDDLRVAIEARGLMHLVAKNGAVAGQTIEHQLNGDQSNQNYDPLMAANFAIWTQALHSFGLEMMAPDAPCPLCYKTELESTCTDPNCGKQTGDMWVQFAADDQLAAARERGLVPVAS